MHLTVVIPTRDRPEQLRALLVSLADAAAVAGLDATELEVIVCNDGGAVERSVTAGTLPLRVLPGPRRGAAANRNVGIRAARGDVVVLVDDDCLVDRRWLRALADSIADQSNADAAVFEGRTVVDEPRTRLDQVSPVNETGGYYWTCNLAVRRSTFDEVGGFDESFPYADMEDVEFAHRFRSAGLRGVFVAEAVVVHPFRIRSPLREARSHRASARKLVALHPELAHHFDRTNYLRTLAQELRQARRGVVAYRGRGLGRTVVRMGTTVANFVRPPTVRGSTPPVGSPDRAVS